jgi:ubiquinone/menaquinone biosynthesis C-methylase UbiE
MTAAAHTGAVAGFYDRHPINEEQILGALRARGVPLDRVTEDDLQAFDQDHYGGVEALATLASAAGITRAHHVLDVCSGMGGPARWLAHRLGCRVTGLDLTASRVRGAARLTRLAKLDDRVDYRLGNALDMPFADASFDVAIAQESWAHIPRKARLVAEAVRVLRPGGVLAFTDIVRREALPDEVARRLLEGMTFVEIESPAGYAQLLEANGCPAPRIEDLSEAWTVILRNRLAMYRSLKDSTVASFGLARYEQYDGAYSFFVSLYEKGILGGARVVGRKARRGPGI